MGGRLLGGAPVTKTLRCAGIVHPSANTGPGSSADPRPFAAANALCDFVRAYSPRDVDVIYDYKSRLLRGC
eukprot:3480310-Pyramimonas_sp.AAC.1